MYDFKCKMEDYTEFQDCITGWLWESDVVIVVKCIKCYTMRLNYEIASRERQETGRRSNHGNFSNLWTGIKENTKREENWQRGR